MRTEKNVHFLCLEPRETDKNVLKFSKNWVLKFHFLLLGALRIASVGVRCHCSKARVCIADLSLC